MSGGEHVRAKGGDRRSSRRVPRRGQCGHRKHVNLQKQEGSGKKLEDRSGTLVEDVWSEKRAIGSRRRRRPSGSSLTDSNCTDVGDPASVRTSTQSPSHNAWALGKEEPPIWSRRREGRDGLSVTDSNATELDGGEVLGKKVSLTIVTGNGRGRGRLMQFMNEDHVLHGRHCMDVFLGQEQGIPAVKSEGGGTSGGVLIAVRPRIGMGPHPYSKAWELVEGRLMVAHIDALCKGGVYKYCVYL